MGAITNSGSIDPIDPMMERALDDGDQGGMVTPVTTPAQKKQIENPKFKFKYGEDQMLKDAFDYVKSTYGQHYVSGDGDTKDKVQVLDLWESIGIAAAMCQGDTIKYISRYGKKAGHNKKDLLKAMHYILLLWHFTKDEDDVTGT